MIEGTSAWLKIVCRFFAVVLFCSSSIRLANAQMADPSELPAATPQQEEIIRDVASEFFSDGDISSLHAFSLRGIGGSELLIARFVGGSCVGEYCATIFVMMKDEDVRIILLALLPNKYSVLDVINKACDACDGYHVIYFYDDSGKVIPIGVSEAYGVVIARE